MTPNIPIPTDNIYKFYASFGFVLLIAALVSFVYVHNSTNEKVLAWVTNISKLENSQKITKYEEEQIDLYKKLIEVSKKDKKLFSNVLLTTSVLGLFVSGFGFYKWEKEIQPRDDKLTELKIKQLENELRRSSNKKFQRTRYTRR